MEERKTLDQALAGLTANSVIGDSGAASCKKFEELLPGATVNSVKSWSDIKGIKEDIVQATVTNTIVQATFAYKMDYKTKNVAKDMAELGISAKYKYGPTNGGTTIAVLIEQNGQSILCKEMCFLPSTKEVKGLKEDTSYETSGLQKAYAVAAGAGFGAIVSAGTLATIDGQAAVYGKAMVNHLADAAKSGAKVAQLGSKANALSKAGDNAVKVAVANVNKSATQITEAAVNEAAENLAQKQIAQGMAEASARGLAKTADEVVQAGADALSTALATAEHAGDAMIEQSMSLARDGFVAKEAMRGSLQNAGANGKVLGKELAEGGMNVVTGIGGAINQGATKVITEGAKVATKMGVKGAEAGADKVATALASEAAAKATGWAAVAVAVAATGFCAFKACEYTPKVYHVQDAAGGTVLSFCMIKKSGDTKEIGVSKSAKSVFVYSKDYFDVVPSTVIDAYPVVPQKYRKGLYGMFATTSTGWPKSKEREAAVIAKFTELKATT